MAASHNDTAECAHWNVVGDAIRPWWWPAVTMCGDSVIYYDDARAYVIDQRMMCANTVVQPAAGMMWRGMCDDEYRQAQQRGYFESLGWGVNPDQRGTTFFTNMCLAAAHYATHCATWWFRPVFGKPAHVVGIPTVDDTPQYAVQTFLDDDAKLALQVRDWSEFHVGGARFDDVRVHYVGHPAIITQEHAATEPSVVVQWEEGPCSTTA